MKTTHLKIIEAAAGITGSLLFLIGYWLLSIIAISAFFYLAIVIDNKETQNENNTSR